MSTINASYIPIVVAILTAIAGLFVYVFQKSVDRKVELRKLRQDAYSNFLRAFDVSASIQSPDSRDDPKEFLKAITNYRACLGNIYLCGSDDVILKVGSFHSYMHNSSAFGGRTGEEFYGYYLPMILAMRKDCFVGSKLTLQQLEDIGIYDFK